MHFPVKIMPTLFAKVSVCEPLCFGLLLRFSQAYQVWMGIMSSVAMSKALVLWCQVNETSMVESHLVLNMDMHDINVCMDMNSKCNFC